MDWKQYKLAFDVGVWLINGLVIAWLYLLSRQRVTREMIEQTKEGNREIEKRVLKIETQIEHLPNRDDINRIRERLDKLSESLATNNGQLKGITRQLNNIDRHLGGKCSG